MKIHICIKAFGEYSRFRDTLDRFSILSDIEHVL